MILSTSFKNHETLYYSQKLHLSLSLYFLTLLNEMSQNKV